MLLDDNRGWRYSLSIQTDMWHPSKLTHEIAAAPGSLETLPFDSNSFDFVRICCIGLEVPEDSWQELLEVRHPPKSVYLCSTTTVLSY